MNRAQQRFLQFYRDHRDSLPTLGEYVIRFAPRLLLRGVLVAACGVFVAQKIMPEILCFTAGMLVGSALRDIPYWRGTIVMWPLIQVITNWNEVERLLGEGERHPSASR